MPQVLAERMRKGLNERGTLGVLRRGTQALNSTNIREMLLHILLGPGQLYETLRDKARLEGASM